MVAFYQRAQSSRWRRPTYVSLLCQLNTTARLRPLRHLHGSLDRLRRKLHCLTGASPMGQIKTPSVRESTGRGSVSEKRSPTTVAPLESFQYSIHPCWAHLSGSNVCVRVLLCSIKGRHPLEKGQVQGKPGWAENRLIHTKSNTPHSGCRVLRSGGPNHSKFVRSCVLAPKLDRPNRLALPRVLPLRE